MNKIDFLQKEIQKPNNWLLKELYMRNRDIFTMDDLLYFFPNNKLKRVGIAMKRGGSKKKKKIRNILHNQLTFNIIEDIIRDVLYKSWEENDWCNKFVSYKKVG